MKVVTRGVEKQKFMVMESTMKEAKKREAKAMGWRMRPERLETSIENDIHTDISIPDILLAGTHRTPSVMFALFRINRLIVYLKGDQNLFTSRAVGPSHNPDQTG